MSVSAAAAITRRAVAHPPVNDTLSTPGWRTSASPAARTADHDVERARREPGLERELGEAQRAERRDLRRLHHDGVAGGQRGHRLLAHAHHRAVPRHDRADHAVGLGQHDVERVARDRHDLAVELVDPPRVVARPRRGVGTRPHRAHRRAVVERVDRARFVVVAPRAGRRVGTGSPCVPASAPRATSHARRARRRPRRRPRRHRRAAPRPAARRSPGCGARRSHPMRRCCDRRR